MILQEERRLRPILQVRTLAELHKLFPNEIHHEVSYTLKGKKITCVYLQYANLFLLPSGPPVLIFDAKNVLVDYCSDVGEAPAFNEKWGIKGR